ncbi:MAG: endonuclease/exonuclease/phosphatase family protein [bacterium]|nr:endonuclease/exonuclease/phosphatase family protein [bacterium]
MSASLKLVCLNIEKDRHLDRVVPFLSEQMPDVFCAQEVYESSIPAIAEALPGSEHVYVPMTRRPKESPPQMQGVAIFSRFPVRARDVHYYVGVPGQVPDSDDNDPATYNANNRPLVTCDVEKDGTTFRVCTTHFTWTPDGEPTDEQRNDMRALLKILEPVNDLILCGDFNVSRGGELFGRLAERYKGNVPPQYTTSIDGDLHRRGQLNRMVDSIFSTPNYVVSGVEMVSGVSDHQALVATISRA